MIVRKFYREFFSQHNEIEISWAAHLGGAVTGLTIGMVVLRNQDKKWWESVLTVIFAIIFIIYLGKGRKKSKVNLDQVLKSLNSSDRRLVFYVELFRYLFR